MFFKESFIIISGFNELYLYMKGEFLRRHGIVFSYINLFFVKQLASLCIGVDIYLIWSVYSKLMVVATFVILHYASLIFISLIKSFVLNQNQIELKTKK